MASTLPPLSAIRCFEAAARHGSFTAAAQELGMTQAAVSYQIKLLEERIGTSLFLRGARGVQLTDTGRQLAPAVGEAFSMLRQAFEDVRDSPTGVLAVTAVTTLATNWLVPRLGAFQFAHPGIAVRLDVSARTVDFAREPFDVGIRAGRGDWAGLVAHELLPIAYTPMLSPRLLERAGPLNGPEDLLRLPLLDPADPWWGAWFVAAGAPAPDLAGRPELGLESQTLSGRAAAAGTGVALLEPAFFAEEIAAGRLVQPFPLVHRPGASYWLVYPQARRRAAKIRAFRDWLLAEIAAPA